MPLKAPASKFCIELYNWEDRCGTYERTVNDLNLNRIDNPNDNCCPCCNSCGSRSRNPFPLLLPISMRAWISAVPHTHSKPNYHFPSGFLFLFYILSKSHGLPLISLQLDAFQRLPPLPKLCLFYSLTFFLPTSSPPLPLPLPQFPLAHTISHSSNTNRRSTTMRWCSAFIQMPSRR